MHWQDDNVALQLLVIFANWTRRLFLLALFASMLSPNWIPIIAADEVNSRDDSGDVYAPEPYVNRMDPAATIVQCELPHARTFYLTEDQLASHSSVDDEELDITIDNAVIAEDDGFFGSLENIFDGADLPTSGNGGGRGRGLSSYGNTSSTLSLDDDIYATTSTTQLPDDGIVGRAGGNGSNNSQQQRREYRLRECWCAPRYLPPTSSRRRYYCAEKFDRCQVHSRSETVACFAVPKKTTFVRGFWPVCLFWYGALLYIFVASEQGQLARQYIKRRIGSYIVRLFTACCSSDMHDEQERRQQPREGQQQENRQELDTLVDVADSDDEAMWNSLHEQTDESPVPTTTTTTVRDTVNATSPLEPGEQEHAGDSGDVETAIHSPDEGNDSSDSNNSSSSSNNNNNNATTTYTTGTMTVLEQINQRFLERDLDRMRHDQPNRLSWLLQSAMARERNLRRREIRQLQNQHHRRLIREARNGRHQQQTQQNQQGDEIAVATTTSGGAMQIASTTTATSQNLDDLSTNDGSSTNSSSEEDTTDVEEERIPQRIRRLGPFTMSAAEATSIISTSLALAGLSKSTRPQPTLTLKTKLFQGLTLSEEDDEDGSDYDTDDDIDNDEEANNSSSPDKDKDVADPSSITENEQETKQQRRKTSKRCAICLVRVQVGDVVGDISCGHVFHKACLKSWLSKGINRCPLCQQTGIATASPLLLPESLRNTSAGPNDIDSN